MSRSFQAVLLTAVASGALSAGAGTARAATYLQTDLVSDLSALGAKITDPSLKNPWGLSFLPGQPDLGFGPGNPEHDPLWGDGRDRGQGGPLRSPSPPVRRSRPDRPGRQQRRRGSTSPGPADPRSSSSPT